MDWLTFLAALIHAVAWPIAAVAIVLLFREPLLRLLPSLRELQGFGLALRFDRAAVEKVANKIMQAGGDVARVWDRRVLKALIVQLPRIERLIVILHYIEEMPLSEVATSLDMKETEVRARLDSVLRELKKRMNAVRDAIDAPPSLLKPTPQTGAQ